MRKCVIIGSGLGGLSCGSILAKNGYDVTILEQGAQAGGCLQCFRRGGELFETGMHYIGSADEGQTLHTIFRYLGVDKDIKLARLNPMGYDVISFMGHHYRLANGKDGFVDTLADVFPNSREELSRYYDLISLVASSSPLHSLRGVRATHEGQVREGATHEGQAPCASQASHTGDSPCVSRESSCVSGVLMEAQTRSVNEVIEGMIGDPLLREVLAGIVPLYAGRRDRTPFFTHALIADFYHQSCFRFVGGSGLLADALVRSIRDKGGRVLTGHRVSKIVCDERRAMGVMTANGEWFEADIIISAIHPAQTMALTDSPLLRPAYRQRLAGMENSTGAFTVYLKFHKNRVRYMDHNLYYYRGKSVWGCEDYDEGTWPKFLLYMHGCHEENPEYAETGEIITYMNYREVVQWQGRPIGHRGEDYELLKRMKAERAIDALEEEIPGIRNDIEQYYTSTPLTYADYTGIPEGAMYGYAKDVNTMGGGSVACRTRIPNLLLTGQCVELHGMLGVLAGSLVTCSEVLTPEVVFGGIMSNEK